MLRRSNWNRTSKAKNRRRTKNREAGTASSVTRGSPPRAELQLLATPALGVCTFLPHSSAPDTQQNNVVRSTEHSVLNDCCSRYNPAILGASSRAAWGPPPSSGRRSIERRFQ